MVSFRARGTDCREMRRGRFKGPVTGRLKGINTSISRSNSLPLFQLSAPYLMHLLADLCPMLSKFCYRNLMSSIYMPGICWQATHKGTHSMSSSSWYVIEISCPGFFPLVSLQLCESLMQHLQDLPGGVGVGEWEVFDGGPHLPPSLHCQPPIFLAMYRNSLFSAEL